MKHLAFSKFSAFSSSFLNLELQLCESTVYQEDEDHV